MFVVHQDGRALDFDLAFFEDLAVFLDGRLDAIALDAASSPDPDALGHFDTAEYISAIGFIACQTYMAATYGPLGIGKPVALQVGPVHSSGAHVAALLNHAANFAKHSPEWSAPHSRSAGQRTLDGIGTLDLTPEQCWYPLTSILAIVVAPAPPRFGPLVPLLQAWRGALPGA